MAVPPAFRVPSQRPLAPSETSDTSVANNKGDNEIIQGCTTSHCLKWGPFPPNEVGRIAQHVTMGDRRKDGKDGEKKKIKIAGRFKMLIINKDFNSHIT